MAAGSATTTRFKALPTRQRLAPVEPGLVLGLCLRSGVVAGPSRDRVLLHSKRRSRQADSRWRLPPLSPRSEEFIVQARERAKAAREMLAAGRLEVTVSVAYYAMLNAARLPCPRMMSTPEPTEELGAYSTIAMSPPVPSTRVSTHSPRVRSGFASAVTTRQSHPIPLRQGRLSRVVGFVDAVERMLEPQLATRRLDWRCSHDPSM